MRILIGTLICFGRRVASCAGPNGLVVWVCLNDFFEEVVEGLSILFDYFRRPLVVDQCNKVSALW